MSKNNMVKRILTFLSSIISYLFGHLDEILAPEPRAKNPTSTAPEVTPERIPSEPVPPAPPRPTTPVPESEPEPIPDSIPEPEIETDDINFLWPTQFPGVVTQPFGVNPAIYEPWGVPAHEGIDMKASSGTNIYAVWNGVVSRVEFHKAYGNSIRIRHEIEGNIYESVYAHFREPALLKVGEAVVRGFVIGLAGTTGNSTGSHLHFMLKQFAGELPDTEKQKKYDWPFDIVDPTPFFEELR